MTPAERGLLVAMAKIVTDGVGRIGLLYRMIEAVELEDARRPKADRMPIVPDVERTEPASQEPT